VFRTSEEQTFVFYWVYALATVLHIYFDFSGYSDMAIGLGKFFGFRFPENFNYPYMSRSITEFWRRWHMSLGSWFRDYVYIPLGGNRVSKGRHLLNIFIVWMLTGFWHGAEWNFIIWGVYFGILLMVEKLWLLKKLEKAKVWNRVYVLFLITISFVIFNAGSTAQMLSDLQNMFLPGSVANGMDSSVLVGAECLYYVKSYSWILMIGIIGVTNFPKRVVAGLRKQATAEKVLVVLEPIALLFILLLSTAYLIDGSFNPFLYFRF